MELMQSIPLSSVRNARELGGYKTADGKTIKKGLLLRTAKLNEISDEDVKLLIEKYNLGEIVDFRFDMEIENQKDRNIYGASYHQIDVMDFSGLGIDDAGDKDLSDLKALVEMMEKIGMLDGSMYIGFLEKEKGIRGYEKFFRILIGVLPEKSVLWHCTSGKDRTGIAAMLLMSALGVDEETIISDYILTNEYNKNRIFGLKKALKQQGYDDEFIDKAPLVFEAVDERFMRNAMAYLKEKYGTVTGYITKKLGIKPEEINYLKEKYLE